MAGILTGCETTATGTVSAVTTSNTPAAPSATQQPVPGTPAATPAPTPTPVPTPTPAQTPTGCQLVYQDHDATISFDGIDAAGWCDRVRTTDGHWMPTLVPASSLPPHGLCGGSTDQGGTWEVRDSGGDYYGKQACVMLNQMGLRQPMEN